MLKNIETRRSFQSSLMDERLWIARVFPELDAAIVERLQQFPEVDHNNFSRESFQDGVGYAFTQFSYTPAPGAFTGSDPREAELRDDVVEAFFRLLPTSKYTDYSEARKQRDWLIRSTWRVFVVEPLEVLPYTANEYNFEAFVAFVEGYQLTVGYFTGEQTFPRPHYHPDLV